MVLLLVAFFLRGGRGATRVGFGGGLCGFGGCLGLGVVRFVVWLCRGWFLGVGLSGVVGVLFLVGCQWMDGRAQDPPLQVWGLFLVGC